MRTLCWNSVLMGTVAVVTCLATPTFAGPDIVYQGLNSISNHGAAAGGFRGYTLGSQTCNIGDVASEWNSNGIPLSPGLAMNVYRLHAGRFEQIGMSWVKTACCVANGSGCGIACSGSGPAGTLRSGCMDTYSSSWNSSQSRMLHRSRINAYTGVFGSMTTASGDAAFRRIRIAESDMNQTNYPGARFFAEGIYAGTGDAQAGNWHNNASYQPVNIDAAYNMSLTGSIQRFIPAIYAWRDHGLGAGVPDPSVNIQIVDVPGEGQFIVGAKATALGNNQWRYDYAIYNLNSHRSGGTLVLPADSGVGVSGIGFHDVDYHSGEIYDNTDWSSVRTSATVQWSSPQSFAENENSNALRWGTMYNFWFTADREPTQVSATLGLFRPGTPDSVSFNVVGPTPTPFCSSDIAPPGGDGSVNIEDLVLVINSWGACSGCPADINGDGSVNVNDLLTVINTWGPCK